MKFLDHSQNQTAGRAPTNLLKKIPWRWLLVPFALFMLFVVWPIGEIIFGGSHDKQR